MITNKISQCFLYGLCFVLIFLLWFTGQQYSNVQQEKTSLYNKNFILEKVLDNERPYLELLIDWAAQDGYSDVKEWYKDYYNRQYQLNYLINNETQFLNEEQAQKINNINIEKDQTHSVIKLKSLLDECLNIVKVQEKIFNYNEDGSFATPSYGLNPYTGVNYHNGRQETYYSSNVLHHYQTNEWIVDVEGFYRTNEGYYVVAASDLSYGTIFEGSKGQCMVLDSGCDAGVTDYYVAW